MPVASYIYVEWVLVGRCGARGRAADMTGITKKGNQDSIGITENTLGFRRDYEK